MSEQIGAPAVEHTKTALSHKIGPLPAGVWGLAILGGVAVAVMVRRNANDQATQDAADTLASQADQTGSSGWDQPDPGGTNPGAGGTTTGTGDGSYPEGGGTTGANPTGPDPSSATYQARRATTNAAWQHWSVKAMQPLGFDPGRTSAVLSAYLHGAKLDATGTAILGSVMSRCGPPPHPPKHKADPGPPPHQPIPRDPDPHGIKDHGHGGPGNAVHHGAQAAAAAVAHPHHHQKGKH